MRGIKAFTHIIGGLITLILALLLMCNIYFAAARAITGEQPTLFGYSTAIVISGSMSPAIEVDDMVIICRKKSYSRGDIITYKDNGSLITHRIAEIAEDGYITKGDANNTNDPKPVTSGRVVGRVVTVIPKVGRIIAALKTPFGLCSVVLFGLLLLEYPALIEKLRAKKEGEHYGRKSEE